MITRILTKTQLTVMPFLKNPKRITRSPTLQTPCLAKNNSFFSESKLIFLFKSQKLDIANKSIEIKIQINENSLSRKDIKRFTVLAIPKINPI